MKSLEWFEITWIWTQSMFRKRKELYAYFCMLLNGVNCTDLFIFLFKVQQSLHINETLHHKMMPWHYQVVNRDQCHRLSSPLMSLGMKKYFLLQLLHGGAYTSAHETAFLVCRWQSKWTIHPRMSSDPTQRSFLESVRLLLSLVFVPKSTRKERFSRKILFDNVSSATSL